MTRSYRTAAIFGLACWLNGCSFACAHPPQPRLYIWWTVSNTQVDTIGTVGWNVTTDGWRVAVNKHLVPWIEWAKRADPNVGVIAHLCFGQYGPGDEDMRLDAYDYAKASGINKLHDLGQFTAAWAPIVAEREVIGYTGDVDRLPWTPANELRLLFERNLKPYKQAGFHRVCIDAAGDAITYPATVAGTTIHRSHNSLLLSYADSLFGSGSSLIEASPRNGTRKEFKPWRQLDKRDVICLERTWRNRHGNADERSGNAEGKGYGDPDYMTGRKLRVVDVTTPEQMVADAQRIVREGCVPCVPAWALVDKVEAVELLGGQK